MQVGIKYVIFINSQGIETKSDSIRKRRYLILHSSLIEHSYRTEHVQIHRMLCNVSYLRQSLNPKIAIC